MSNEDTPNAELRARVQRLEEALGFSEHAADQMLDHLRALDRSVRELARRIDTLEHRMNQVPPTKPASEGEGAAGSGEE